ncbi:MAG TPA: adenylate/guanylate cyclase domain-containing protein [Thermoguttaceae bacterium]|nr:adenylate/guanylate cyclase domain-containing protein [Thermoguttaceae bacterium]
MPDLIAQGEEAQQRWRRALPLNEPVLLGRLSGIWAVDWDHHVSRRHVRLRWTGKELEVTRLPDARNPIYFQGREENQFVMHPGEHFVVGQTTFALADQRANITADGPEPVQQQSFSAQYLKQVSFRNPNRRIEVLYRLPKVIAGAAGDNELCVRLVSMLLAGVPRADSAAVVAVGDGEVPQADAGPDYDADPDARLPDSVQVMHWDQRLVIGSDFRPSEGLILESLHQRQSVLHVWRGADTESADTFTESENVDWAFCVPVLGRPGSGWGLYVAGRFTVEQSSAPSSDPTDLREDVKFTELVASMLSALRQMRQLEHQQATLSQFFSPVVLKTLATEDPDVVLAPRETEVSVLFCDLRGFSRETERHADDLLGLLRRVSKALGVTTDHIRREGGVVGDFHGDAAMGFWGWPLPQDDAVLRTCRAALGVRADFTATTDFHVGIGVATGKAMAGKIGTVDQVKVTVFGPVVNLASRLEGMTKLLRVPILLDEPTARAIRKNVPRDVARVRRLARVKPFGLDTPLEVSELLPPESQFPLLSDEHLQFYESALDAFLAGDWSEALELLHRLPPEDMAKDFLTVHIAQHNRIAPEGFDGVIPLKSK